MSSANAARMVFNGGTIIITPTNLSAASPYGGTVLGSCKENILRRTERSFVVSCPADFGAGQPVERIRLGTAWAMTASFRTWDNDQVSTLFPLTATGSSGLKYVAELGSTYAGDKGTARAVKVLYAPDNPKAHPAILFLSAIPVLADDAEIKLDYIDEMMLPGVFLALPASSGNSVQMGLLEDLTL